MLKNAPRFLVNKMNGIICIDKEEGITSFGVCSRLRRLFGEKKVGHAGTLDPMATGVLPVLLGGATRFLEYLPDEDKGYTAVFELGKTTDTLDITGTLLSQSEVNVTAEEVIKAGESFVGKISQLPPMYSAVSVGGERLYNLARKGVEIERKPREVEIKRLEIKPLGGNLYQLFVLCSKGTYVRSLIDDIGSWLGCGAVMTALRRELACGFPLDACRSLSELQALSVQGESLEKLLLPIDKALASYDEVRISEAQATRFKNGGALDLQRLKNKQLISGGLYRVYSPGGDFLGLGRSDENELKVEKLYIKR